MGMNVSDFSSTLSVTFFSSKDVSNPRQEEYARKWTMLNKLPPSRTMDILKQFSKFRLRRSILCKENSRSTFHFLTRQSILWTVNAAATHGNPSLNPPPLLNSHPLAPFSSFFFPAKTSGHGFNNHAYFYANQGSVFMLSERAQRIPPFYTRTSDDDLEFLFGGHGNARARSHHAKSL